MPNVSFETILVVRARAFLSLYGQERFENFLARHAKSPDEKYSCIENDIANSAKEPLAVPHVHCEMEGRYEHTGFFWWKQSTLIEVPKLDFTNGITRTTWLINNGCKEFPVKCHPSEVDRLQEIAGCEVAQILAVEDVIELAKLSPYCFIGFPR